MEFWTTIGRLLRNKRVFIPTALVALTLGAVAYLVTPSTYVSSATMVLATTKYGGVDPHDPTKPAQLTNPMLNFNDSLKTTSTILVEAMNTKGVMQEVGATRADTQLIVNDGSTNPTLLGTNGPFVYIAGRSSSPAKSRLVVLAAQQMMKQKLNDYQGALHAPQKTYVSLVDVVPPTAPVAGHGRATKLAALAVLLGGMLCVAIAYLGDRLRLRRRARAAAACSPVGLAWARGATATEDTGQEGLPAWLSEQTVVGPSWPADVGSTHR